MFDEFDTPFIQAPIKGLPWLLAFTTLRCDGAGRVYDYGAGDGAACSQRRAELQQALAPLRISWLTLEHATRCVEVPPASTACVADAAIVVQAGYAAALTTADCLPITLACATPRPCAALIHAGWRGLAAGIIEDTLANMANRHGCPPAKIQAHIGPGVQRQDYEVGLDTYQQLLASVNVSREHFSIQAEKPGHFLADLPAMAMAKLLAAGIPRAAISVHPTSTKADTQLHSVRRDGSSAGRMASVVAITQGV
jgi:YfiH family protein